VEDLAVFVYGTLRPGEHNHAVLADDTLDAWPAVLADHALYARGLPYVVARAGHQVRGDLMALDPRRYAATLRRLDQLEGYDPQRPARCHYVRTRCVVRIDGEGGQLRPAWVYLAGPQAAARVITPSALVPSGDWKELRHAA
jgi:gamma-glutamylcyclotransferase (GGCT)/AIG2-like uncharacterized protein YtfP